MTDPRAPLTRRALPRDGAGRRPPLVGALAAMLLASTGLVAVGLGGAGAAELPLKRVVLSTAGLGQFAHFGPVEAGTTVDLPVRLDQVDDILKSLTVFDAVGAVGPVSLPGREPLAELFRDLPFDQSALESPTALIAALVGSEVEIAGPVAAKGRIFRVEAEQVALPNGLGATTRHRLSLLTDKGLVQAILEDVTTLAFTDGQTRGQIDRALAGLIENRAKDRRRLALSVLGQGKRDIGVAYVVAAPIWKTSWRLVVPKDGAKARLQGWAVLENLTGGDWKDVELTLVSGDPVALTQPLYEAAYGSRTEIPVAGSRAAVPLADDAPAARPAPAPAMAAPMAGAMRKSMMVAEQAGEAEAAAMAPPPPMAPVAAQAAARTEEGTTQLLHRFPGRVSLATGHTMMLPFVDREIAARRVWLYQPETNPKRPMAAVKLTNDGETGLPGGIVTAFETSAQGATDHVGDAVLPLTARGASKIVSFALDTKTEIRREDRGVKRSEIGTMADGVLNATIRSRRTIAYEITAPADDDRVVVIDEPRAAGWAPPAEAKGIETTPSRIRLEVAAAKGATTRAELVQERVDRQTVTLVSMPLDDVLVRIRGLDSESPVLREAVAKLGEVVGEIGRARGQKAKFEAERKRIGEDQARLRDNLGKVGAATDLGRRYVDTLRTQEDRIGEIDLAMAQLDKTIAARQDAAVDMVRKLKF